MGPQTSQKITPEVLLTAYASGVFPMSESRDTPEIFWVDPEARGILPLDGFHMSHSLARAIRRGNYTVRIDGDFAAVVTACAARPETWINGEIFDLYAELHRLGCAHSLEVFAGSELIGGAYGVALASAFFGESMFSHQTNGSKIALACLVARLRSSGFTLLDTQFLTPHLASLGAIEISRTDYQQRLANALETTADFNAHPPLDDSAAGILHLNTQTS